MRRIFWMIVFLLNFSALIILVFADSNKGKELFDKKCSTCHPTRLPLNKNKTPDEWANTVMKMQAKMKFMTEKEAQLIVEYLAETRPIKENEKGSIDEILALERSLDLGKSLFNDIRLGGNGKSCSSCHDNKKKSLNKKAYLYPKYYSNAKKVISLEQRINYCIMINMEGESLRLGSDEIISLTVYLYSLI